jgi:TolB protein
MKTFRVTACAAALLALGAGEALAELRTLPISLGKGRTSPAACSDGRRLAYCMNTGESGGGPEIFYLDLENADSPPVRVTTSPGRDGKPSWSPDCTRIAFMSGRSGNEDIWVQRLDGEAILQMTSSPWGHGYRAQEWGPAWSPDGARIAFSSDRSGDDDLWWVPAEGGEMVRFTKRTLPRDRDQDRQPSWSPDGKRVAYASKTNGSWDLWITVVDDTAGAPQALTTEPSDEWLPAWSPNGRWIVYVSNLRGNNDLFVMPAAGGEAVQLTTNSGADGDPCWSADGRTIYYTAIRGEDAGIWALDRLEAVLGRDFASGSKPRGRGNAGAGR